MNKPTDVIPFALDGLTRAMAATTGPWPAVGGALVITLVLAIVVGLVSSSLVRVFVLVFAVAVPLFAICYLVGVGPNTDQCPKILAAIPGTQKTVDEEDKYLDKLRKFALDFDEIYQHPDKKGFWDDGGKSQSQERWANVDKETIVRNDRFKESTDLIRRLSIVCR